MHLHSYNLTTFLCLFYLKCYFFYTQKWSSFEICWCDARKARFSVIVWNRFGDDSVNSGNDSTLVQIGCKLSACQILQFDRCVFTKVNFFIGI